MAKKSVLPPSRPKGHPVLVAGPVQTDDTHVVAQVAALSELRRTMKKAVDKHQQAKSKPTKSR